MKIYLIIALLICLNVCNVAFSQTTGLPSNISDTTFIFTSPRPLIVDGSTTWTKKNINGFEIMLSNFGVGFGFIYERILNKNYKFASSLFFTPVKNTEELRQWDPVYYDFRVPNKVRRISAIPLNIGMQRYVHIGNLSKSFRPFVGVLAAPTLIWEMPYERDWFRDVGFSNAHFRIGGGAQIGADFGALNTSLISVRMRYIYTPFGGEGLESVKDSPIKNFGGFYISLALGGLF